MFRWLKQFFWPSSEASLWKRLLPYLTLAAAATVTFILVGAGWEYTNTSAFCGTSCHTMPPEYSAYLASPHVNVKCIECHIGRATIATQFFRKAHDISHVVRLIGADYELPLYSKTLRPASQVCEKCHNPTQFSPDSLRTIKHYNAEKNNELEEINLAFKIGGGTHREGRGKGIHWHVENPVDYIATDPLEQEIPWVRVTDPETGEATVYTDIEADLPPDFAEQNADSIKQMDCMTCHNRETHEFKSPDTALDDAMSRGVVPADIPYIKKNAVAVMERNYPTMGDALAAIRGLKNYYASNWSEYYTANTERVDAAVEELAGMYQNMVFPTMDVSWNTHPDNLGHKDSAGCFRCHDGKHVTEDGEAIRIECNLCHTIPVKNSADGSAPTMVISDQYEPQTHSDTNWISQHRYAFDDTCKGCHDVSNPGGSDDSSFCANSACHATDWKFAGLDATDIVSMTNKLAEDLPTYPESPLTWDDLVGPILQARCVACHGGTAGLYLDSYEGAMAGGNLGPAIVPGNAEDSLLVQLQRAGHPNSLSARELEWITQWINEGAPQSQPMALAN
jgi:hypothetical protein